MPVLTQLNLNIGTEQNPNMVLHDLHDIRISSTDVTTVTRLLGCDAGVNSIAPITLANAASLLGVIPVSSTSDLDNLPKKFGFYRFSGTSPFAVHSLVINCVFPNLTYGFQVVIERAYNKINMRNLTNDVWETTWASITLS